MGDVALAEIQALLDKKKAELVQAAEGGLICSSLGIWNLFTLAILNEFCNCMYSWIIWFNCYSSVTEPLSFSLLLKKSFKY